MVYIRVIAAEKHAFCVVWWQYESGCRTTLADIDGVCCITQSAGCCVEVARKEEGYTLEKGSVSGRGERWRRAAS